LERLGELQSAIDVYSEVITKHPRNGELFMARGLALYGVDLPRALKDLRTAVQMGVPSIWPYLLLARHALQSGAPGEALRLARAAENQPGHPSARAEVYELIAMALAESGRPQEEVLESFDRALALDPMNDRIRENREIAAAPPPPSRAGKPGRRHLLSAPPIEPERLQRARGDEIRDRSELYNKQPRDLSHASKIAG
jgi:tetratricopeptide (TPR) repeat protein